MSSLGVYILESQSISPGSVDFSKTSRQHTCSDTLVFLVNLIASLFASHLYTPWARQLSGPGPMCIYIYARGAKFSDTSCFWVIGHFENCVLAVVICTFLSIVFCLDLMFDGRFFCVRLHKLKYKMRFSLVPLTLCWNCSFSLFVFCVVCFNNPLSLLLNVPQILKTGVHLQFLKISVWPIWLLIDPL